MSDFLEDPITKLSTALSPSSSDELTSQVAGPTEIYFMCRRGNDSLISARALQSALDQNPDQATSGRGKNDWTVKDVKGGVRAWSRDVDPEFPLY